jgi:hypothetical protein
VNLFSSASVYLDVKDLSAESDGFLLGSIANGDPDAVRPLIERYQRPLFALLRRALARSADVDDVAQETWPDGSSRSHGISCAIAGRK